MTDGEKYRDGIFTIMRNNEYVFEGEDETWLRFTKDRWFKDWNKKGKFFVAGHLDTMINLKINEEKK